jgi:acyl dehydratase
VTDVLLAFEDFQVGQIHDLGSKTVDRDELLAFARSYDPQPMHLDEEAAKASLLGGLAASGWHAGAMFMRLLYDGLLAKTRSFGAPGIDKLAWKRPVRPGDTLHAVAEVVATRVSKGRPDLGIVGFRFLVTNALGETVMTVEHSIFIQTRAHGDITV